VESIAFTVFAWKEVLQEAGVRESVINDVAWSFEEKPNKR